MAIGTLNTAYNLSTIQKFMFDYLKGVCTDTYIETIPEALSDKDTDFMVISTPISIDDKDAFGNCIIRVEIFTRSLKRGMKNIPLMQAKEAALITKINSFSNTDEDATYFLSYQSNISDYDNTIKYHVSVYFLTLTITK